MLTTIIYTVIILIAIYKIYFKINSMKVKKQIYSACGNGEPIEFYYMGSKDSEYKKRKAIIIKIRENSGYTYVDAVDIDISENRTFRLDRIA